MCGDLLMGENSHRRNGVKVELKPFQRILIPEMLAISYCRTNNVGASAQIAGNPRQ